jgi:hypothetical protein
MLIENKFSSIAENIKTSAEVLFSEFNSNKENLIREENPGTTIYPVIDAVGVYAGNNSYFGTLIPMLSGDFQVMFASFVVYKGGLQYGFRRYFNESLPIERYFITNIDKDGNNNIGVPEPTTGEGITNDDAVELKNLNDDELFDVGNRNANELKNVEVICVDFWKGAIPPTQLQKNNYLLLLKNEYKNHSGELSAFYDSL